MFYFSGLSFLILMRAQRQNVQKNKKRKKKGHWEGQSQWSETSS